jgi:uncharacterized protein YybS (DUF2232 family)
VGSILFVFVPLPIFYYCLKAGRIHGLAVFIASLVVVFVVIIILADKTALPVPLLLGFWGIILAEFLKKSYPIEKIILYSAISLLIPGLALLTYGSFTSGETLQGFIEGFIAKSIQDSIQFYSQNNILSEQVKLIKDDAPQIIRFFTDTFFSIALVGACLVAWLNILAGRALFQRKKLLFPNLGDLVFWKVPEKFVWILIAGGIIYLVPVKMAGVFGNNILIVCCFVYLLQGFAIVGFFFRKFNMPRIYRGGIYFLFFAQQYLMLLLVTAGLFDMWIDFRKMNKPSV